MDDTPPEVERRCLEGLRQRTPAERFRRVGDLMEMLELGARAETRLRYPDASDYEIRLRVASRRIPAETMRAAFGWDPDRDCFCADPVREGGLDLP